MSALDRKTGELLAAWDRFCEREKGFFPPKIAGLYLGLTPQGLYAAADRGWLRFFKVGSERFYSFTDLIAYKRAGLAREEGARLTPLDRHLARAGVRPMPRRHDKSHETVDAWFWFLLDHQGAFPPRLAAGYLRITPQSVLAASRKGWIRRFQVGRENFYSRIDVQNYWHSGSARNRENRPFPRFENEPIGTTPLPSTSVSR